MWGKFLFQYNPESNSGKSQVLTSHLSDSDNNNDFSELLETNLESWNACEESDNIENLSLPEFINNLTETDSDIK